MRVFALAGAHKESADNAGENTPGSQQQRHDYTLAIIADSQGSAQRNGGNNRTNVRLKQIGTHTGNVAHVIAHVISDNGRVTRIVLRDAGFHLANQVGAHVGSFSVNTAAHTAKQGHGRCAQGKAVDYSGLPREQYNNNTQAQQAQAHHAHTHNSAAGKSYAQGFVQTALLCSVSRTGIGLGSNAHTNITSQNGTHSASDKGNHSHRVQTALSAAGKHTSHHQNHSHSRHKNQQGFVLTAQKGHCTLMNRTHNFRHLRIARLHRGYTLGQHHGKKQSQHAASRRDYGSHRIQFTHNFLLILLFFLRKT